MPRHLIHTLLKITALIVLALIWISYFSPVISPETCWCIAVLALFYPVLFVLAVFMLVLTFFTKHQRLFFFFLLSILAGWGYTGKLFNLKNHSTAIENAKEIRVTSYNVRVFSLYENENINNSSRQHIIHFLDSTNSDIICLQESVWDDRNVFKTTDTIAQLKHYFVHQDFGRTNHYYHFGAVTFSRYPIIKKYSIAFDNSNDITLITDIKIGTDTIRIINTHLQSNHFSKREYQYLDDPNNIAIEQTKGILKRLREAFIKRAKQLDILETEINQSPYPVLLCGDFNDIPNSYTHHIFSKYLYDSFLKSGYGFGTTYNEFFLKYRIDYIFYDSKKFNNINSRVINVGKLSDHLPVFSVFQLIPSTVSN